MHRRNLLTAALGASVTTIAGRAWSAPASDQRLLVIFLRGGYDAINIVIPTYSDLYYEARPRIGIARPDPTDPASALPLDNEWSLHPTLRDSIYPLWKEKQVAFVPFAGTDDMTRSHFETQDTIELGQPVGTTRNYRSGFMARLAHEISGARPIAFTTHAPLVFHGAPATPNIAVQSADRRGVGAHLANLIQDMYRGHELQDEIAEGFSVRRKAYSNLSQEMKSADRDGAPPHGFELAARRVARMLKTDYNLAFLDVGGWDTHVNQGGASGVLAERMGRFGKGLAALVDEIGPANWMNTTVVVLSEFGRTFKENGDKGTDHGHGSVYWVLGGSVSGGRIAGEQVHIAHKSLNTQRDLPVLTDYRSLLAQIVRERFLIGADQVNRIFPNIGQISQYIL